MRPLRRGIDDQFVEPVVPIGYNAPRFERHHRLPIHLELAAHLDRSTGDAGDVSLRDGRVDESIVRPAIEQRRHSRLDRLNRVDNRRQIFREDDNIPGKVLGFRARRCDAGRDRLTDETNTVTSQRRIRHRTETGHLRPRIDEFYFTEIGKAEHLVLESGRLLDTEQPAVRDRTADECDILHARHSQIGHKSAGAQKMPLILLAKEARADPSPCSTVQIHDQTPAGETNEILADIDMYTYCYAKTSLLCQDKRLQIGKICAPATDGGLRSS